MELRRHRTHRSKHWKLLWGSDLTRRAKLFIWRLIMNNMYNLVFIQKIGHGNGDFPMCQGHPETNDHIFFCCSKVQKAWTTTTIYYKQHPQTSSLVDARYVIDVINGSLSKASADIAYLFVVYHTCWGLWNQRNDKIYNNKHPHFSPSITVDLTLENIEVAASYNTSYKKQRRLWKAIKLITPFSCCARSGTWWRTHSKWLTFALAPLSMSIGMCSFPINSWITYLSHLHQKSTQLLGTSPSPHNMVTILSHQPLQGANRY